MPILPFLLFVIVSSFTPGPNNFMAMSFANNYGFKKSMKFCLGVAIGFFILSLLCSFFNSVLIEILPLIEKPLTFLGVGYMLYLAFKTITSKDNDKENEEISEKNLLLLAISIQFINPKGILYGIAVVTTFLLPYYSSFSSYLIFSLFLGIIGFISSLSWSLLGSFFQKSLKRYRVAFNIIMALLLVYSAISIALY